MPGGSIGGLDLRSRGPPSQPTPPQAGPETSVRRMNPSAPPSSPPGPLRVLHCYSGNLYGGIETLLATLARARGLAPGMEPEFALCFEGRLSGELRAAGVRVHSLGAVRFGRPWTVLRARRAMARLLATGEHDLVICHACWPHMVFGPTVRRSKRRIPLVFWMHDAAHGTHWIERIARRTRPEFALVNSRYSAGTLPRLFPDLPHAILHYPVAPIDTSARETVRAEVRRELAVDSDALVVVQTSRLERYKGQSLLVEALGRLADRPGWVAWLAGGVQRPSDQVYLDELEAACRSLGIEDRVRFLGARSDVPRLLMAGDVFCQPNLRAEPFGIAFVEALYAGLPVVSTAMGGAQEIVTGACGVLTPPGDPAALAEALGRLLADSGLRAELGRGGPDRARAMCDPPLVLDRLERTLRALLAPPATRP